MLNEKKFLTIYDDFKTSGLTVRDYCSNQGMNEAKFYYWKQKIKNKVSTTNGFVPVIVEPRQTATKQIQSNLEPASLSYEICYPNGASIKLNGAVNIEIIQTLLQLNLSQNV